MSLLKHVTRGYSHVLRTGKAVITPEVETELADLWDGVKEHSFWNNELFLACDAGYLTRDDFRHVFGQYYSYTSKFTRYLSGVMVNCENDYYRAALSENMWEEGGMQDEDKRHAQLFRNFLSDSLDIDDPNDVTPAVYSKYFSETYLNDILENCGCYGASYLSLGTEGIVAEMYTILRDGMLKAGFDESEMEFFDLHIACDDDHAATLEEMMLDYSQDEGWKRTCEEARDRALDLREEFFNELYRSIGYKKFQDMIAYSVSGDINKPDKYLIHEEEMEDVYKNLNESEEGVEFTVQRANLDYSVMDPRIVRIAPGKKNENHFHAHEACVLFVEGEGEVIIGGGETVSKVKKGDIAYFPRWEKHQVVNTGEEEIVYFAVTDYNFIRNFIGYNDMSYRLK